MCHTLKCSVSLVTYTYQLLNVINLIIELLNAYSWVIHKLRRGTNVMSLNPRSYISLEIFDLSKLVLILKALVKERYSWIFFPLLSADPHIENSTDLLKPATNHTTNSSSPVTVSDNNVDSSGNVLPIGIINSMERQLSNVQDRAEPLRCNPPRTRHPPAKLQDYAAYTIKYPINKFLTYQRLSPLHITFLTTISNVHEQKTFKKLNLKVSGKRLWQKN